LTSEEMLVATDGASCQEEMETAAPDLRKQGSPKTKGGRGWVLPAKTTFTRQGKRGNHAIWKRRKSEVISQKGYLQTEGSIPGESRAPIHGCGGRGDSQRTYGQGKEGEEKVMGRGLKMKRFPRLGDPENGSGKDCPSVG